MKIENYPKTGCGWGSYGLSKLKIPYTGKHNNQLHTK